MIFKSTKKVLRYSSDSDPESSGSGSDSDSEGSGSESGSSLVCWVKVRKPEATILTRRI